MMSPSTSTQVLIIVMNPSSNSKSKLKILPKYPRILFDIKKLCQSEEKIKLFLNLKELKKAIMIE